MTVDVWAARLERPLEEQEMDALLAIMPVGRRKRLEDVQRKDLWREPLCAYALLRWALRERYGWQTLSEIETTEQGKPWFPRNPEIHFNISHTDGAVLVGVADCPVGVDIEKLRPVSQRTMTQVAGTSSERAFFQTWVRREARTKRSGSGIGAMLRSEPPMEQGESYWELNLFPGYLAGAAVCSNEPPELKIRSVTLEELLEESIV